MTIFKLIINFWLTKYVSKSHPHQWAMGSLLWAFWKKIKMKLYCGSLWDRIWYLLKGIWFWVISSLWQQNMCCLLWVLYFICVQLLWNHVNSLWPNDAICHYKIWSTLVQVMACCLTVLSHHLDQYWYISSEVLWASHRQCSSYSSLWFEKLLSSNL